MPWVCALVAAAPVRAADAPHWDYQGHGGAAQWAELDKSFATCKLGKFQSPVNLETAKVAKAAQPQPIGFAYKAGTAAVANNGHTIQVNLSDGGAITVGGAEYKLLQFHFHTPSEEQFDGQSYPLVAHLVHKGAQGQLAVVAVLFKTGKENSALKPVFDRLPAQAGSTVQLEAALKASDLLPADRAYYGFMGSLTTPPCSEEVRWHVLRTPVEMSAAQLAAFKKLYAMNARPVQALNGRPVVLSD